jgi:hypothetical protein
MLKIFFGFIDHIQPGRFYYIFLNRSIRLTCDIYPQDHLPSLPAYLARFYRPPRRLADWPAYGGRDVGNETTR